MKLRLLAPVLGLLFLAASVAKAMPVLDIDANGQLLGAFNVDVNGTLYDVRFVDGTCIDLFDGCDDPSDFPYTGSLTEIVVMAEAASLALMDQVFVDQPLGQFDSVPSLTHGCSIDFACLVRVPIFLSPFPLSPMEIETAIAGNYPLDPGQDPNQTMFVDGVGGGILDPATDLGGAGFGDTNVFALWSLAANPAPEPSIVMLLAGGVLGARIIRRRGR